MATAVSQIMLEELAQHGTEVQDYRLATDIGREFWCTAGGGRMHLGGNRGHHVLIQ